MEILALLAGLLVVAATLFDAFHTIIVPRPIYNPLRVGSYLVDKIWYIWRWLALHIRFPRLHEQLLNLYAPLMIVFLLLFWTAGLIVGFGLIFYAFRSDLQPTPPDLSGAIYFAGTSFLTVGFGDVVATTGIARLIVLCAGTFGIVTLSGAISLIFFLYSALHRRDVLVTMLETCAGSPPSGLILLETYARLNLLAELPRRFARWEEWAAEVQISSISYSLLVYFRSPVRYESWLNALGAMLDAVTLILSCTTEIERGQAYLLYQRGQRLLLSMDNYFHITPHPPDLTVERAFYEQARARLSEAGFQMRETEAAWTEFIELRAGYASALAILANYLVIPLDIQAHTLVPSIRKD